jgi:hypothetical protein
LGWRILELIIPCQVDGHCVATGGVRKLWDFKHSAV